MGLHNADYRVSAIIVLCKDCGEDVGLYPARHKCTNNNRPHLPTLCSSTSDSSSWSSGGEDERQPYEPIQVADNGKWGPKSSPIKEQHHDESVYYEKFAANLSETNTGKKLWGRMKENGKWKELISKKEEKKSGKLWERLIQATTTYTLEHDEAESDQDDWEGETHVSRILREHYQSKRGPLPSWLLQDEQQAIDVDHHRTSYGSKQQQYQQQQQQTIQRSSTRTRRLWQTEDDNQESSRERERRVLRENNNSNKSSFLSRSHSERVPYDIRNENDIYGSIAPRRTNTTRSTFSRIRPFQ